MCDLGTWLPVMCSLWFVLSFNLSSNLFATAEPVSQQWTPRQGNSIRRRHEVAFIKGPGQMLRCISKGGRGVRLISFLILRNESNSKLGFSYSVVGTDVTQREQVDFFEYQQTVLQSLANSHFVPGLYLCRFTWDSSVSIQASQLSSKITSQSTGSVRTENNRQHVAFSASCAMSSLFPSPLTVCMHYWTAAVVLEIVLKK